MNDLSSMIRAICSILPVFAAANTSLAQFDPDDPLVVPGRVVAAIVAEEVVTTISRDVSFISQSPVRVSLKAMPYAEFQFNLPDSMSARAAIRDIFERERENSRIKWWDGVAVIDGTGGQTGSLWVSGPDSDQKHFYGQFAWREIGLVSEPIDAEWSNPRGVSNGGDVLVAVLDTGVDANHPLFGDRVSPFGGSMFPADPTFDDIGNGLDDDGDGLVDEMAGHGTFLAGLVSHIAPQAGILPIKVLNSDGSGDTYQLGAGILKAVDDGAHVVLIALGTYELASGGSSPGMLMVESAIDYAVKQGVTIVASVGNRYTLSGDRCLFPANHPDVVAVGGSNEGSSLAVISNVSDFITVMAPAESMAATVTRSIIGPVPGGRFRGATGTSMSTAFVAGVAALVRAQHPEWPNGDVSSEEIGGEVASRIKLSSTDVNIALDSGVVISRPLLDIQHALDFTRTISPPDGDIDADGIVDGFDLGVVLGWWGAMPSDGTLHRVDQNRDFRVDGADLGIVLGFW